MKRRDFLKPIMLALMLTPTTSPQSRPYAKFGSSGQTVGLFNLLRKTDACAMRQIFEGTVAAVSARKRTTETVYRFALDGTVGQRVFLFALSSDDMSEKDVRSLLTKRQRVRIRACRHAGFWAVEEITQSQ